METLNKAWRRFRSWPMWAQVTCWVVLVIFVGVAAVDDEKPTTVATEATTTTAAPETTSTARPTTTVATYDLEGISANAGGFCVDAAEVGVRGTPGLESQLTDANVTLLVEGAVATLGSQDFPSEDARQAALRGCRTALETYFADLRASARTTTTEPPGPATSFGDGTYEVGVDIEAGTYRTPNNGAAFCYVDVRDGVGQDAGFLDQQVGEGPKIIEPHEGTFVKSSGCGIWSLS